MKLGLILVYVGLHMLIMVSKIHTFKVLYNVKKVQFVEVAMVLIVSKAKFLIYFFQMERLQRSGENNLK